MKLYHFTANHLIGSIMSEGLTRGHLPLVNGDRISLLKGYQWLTINPSYEQSWEVGSSLSYRRNAVKLTIKIPVSYRQNLKRWIEFCRQKPLKETAETLNYQGDPENWFIYKGNIKSNWIRKIEYA